MPREELLRLLIQTAEKNCDLESRISPKELSPGASLYAELGEGFVDTVYYNKSLIETVPVLLLCRNRDQGRCLGQLEDICRYFQRLKKYPSGKAFSWLDTSVAKAPSRIGRDEDGTYHYSCILNCRIHY